MRAGMLLLSLSFIAAPFTACSDVGTREQLTVVVEADRTRALADQARLAEMQHALADAKEELLATRKDLTELREKLMRAGVLSADEMRRLEAREASLRARENPAPAVGAASIPGTTAFSPTGASSAASTKAASTSTASEPFIDVAAEISSLDALRASKGLRADDIEGGAALQKRAEDALQENRNDDAIAAVRELRTLIEGTAVNGAFIKRKYAKASARLDVLQGDAKAQAKKLLGDANTKNAKGDAAGANAALNAVLDL